MYKGKVTHRNGNTTYILGDTKKTVLQKARSYPTSIAASIEITKCRAVILATGDGRTMEMM